MDDELNILPISSSIENIKPVVAESSLDAKMLTELEQLKESLKNNKLLALVGIAKTLDSLRQL